jgi:hypothetical protein
VVGLDRQDARGVGEVRGTVDGRRRAGVGGDADILEDVGAIRKSSSLANGLKACPDWIRPAATARVVKLVCRLMVGSATAAAASAPRRNSTWESSSMAMRMAVKAPCVLENGTSVPPVTVPLVPTPVVRLGFNPWPLTARR